MRKWHSKALVLIVLLFAALASTQSRAQAALLMEEPYGFFGTLNPTGHTAVYFEHVCAETPVKLRRCQPGELGAVLARYSGIANKDWIAIPLVPYLYAVENPGDVPQQVDRALVDRLRDKYHEEHLLSLGEDIPRGGFLHGGWTELIGVSYERRIYAFRFNTTSEQDDAFIARMNADDNHTRFNLLFDNCSDFARVAMNHYFPGTFKRSIFPDAGMTTPKQITFKLVRYARRHRDTDLQVFDIPQIPGYRHHSHANKSIAESLVTTGYAVPIALLNPYLVGGLFVDYLVRGHYNLIPRQRQILGPETLDALTASPAREENPVNANGQATRVASAAVPDPAVPAVVTPGLREASAKHDESSPEL
ncbi:MAG: hypothetical protein P4L40_23505 [Terracidiphilus sp.]|nr:hypothetical protein [Terracidiphilus sp.]